MANTKKIGTTAKPSKGTLERQIKSAITFVPKDKETKSIYFDDKGLKLTVTMDYCVIATGAHQHVFNAITSSGMSKPYIYVKQFLDIALENDCDVYDENGTFVGRSYAKLMQVLKEKEDKTQYNICWFVDLYFFNIFAPLYQIDETEAGAFFIYESYLHNIACNHVLLEERKEDVTNVAYFNKVIELEKSFIENINETVILKAKTDEERITDEIEALQEVENEKVISESIKENANE